MFGVVLSAVFVLADMRRIPDFHIPPLLQAPVIGFAIGTLLICPLVMLITAAMVSASPRLKLRFLCAEAGVTAFHLWSLLPAVS